MVRDQVPLGSGASRKVLALALRGFLLSSNTSIEAAPEPVKLFEGIGKGGCDLGSRLTVQPPCLDKPGTSSRTPEGTSQVSSGLGVVVRTLPTGGVTSGNPQSSESGVVDDHIRFRQHQMVAIACIGVRLRTRHMKHAGTTEGGETVGGSSCGSQLSPGGGSTEMISDGRLDAMRGFCQGRGREPAANGPSVGTWVAVRTPPASG